METNKPKKMSPQQRKFLLSQIGSRWQSAPERERPAAVKKAQSVVDAWERRERAYQRKAQPEFKAAYDQVHKVLLFGTPEEALAAVEEFTAKFKRYS